MIGAVCRVMSSCTRLVCDNGIMASHKSMSYAAKEVDLQVNLTEAVLLVRLLKLYTKRVQLMDHDFIKLVLSSST